MRTPIERMEALAEKHGDYYELITEWADIDSREERISLKELNRRKELEGLLKKWDRLSYEAVGYAQGYKDAMKEMNREA